MKMTAAKRKAEPAVGETATAKLDAFGIEWYCEQIVSGKNMHTVAKVAGVSPRSVYRWLNADPTRLKQSKEARQISAESFVNLAELGIMNAKTDFQLEKAKALAPHYRWHAAKIAPKTYGDRHELVGAGGEPLIPKDDPVEVARRMAFVLELAKQTLDRQ